MTIVYLARHSQPFRTLRGEYKVNEIEQLRNEKNILSCEGEERAKKMSKCKELQKIDVLYSSHYVRAMSTAKYIAELNNIKLNVDERLGERKFGVSDIKNLPKDFFEHQFRDWDYKIPLGESLNETKDRISKAFLEILVKNTDKKVMIVSHGTAIRALFKNWCEVKLNEKTNLVEIYYENKLIFDGNWEAPELFKLEFDSNNILKTIQNIKLNEK